MRKSTLIIIGSGPAAYTAAIYTARANIKTVIYEGFKSGIVGGQLMTTTLVENYPGFPGGIMGPDLMGNMRKQAISLGTEMVSDDVVDVDFSNNPFSIIGDKVKMLCDALIIATGAEARRLDVEGTRDGEFWQKGVSSCAICDGALPIFRNRELFVIGGGDSAVEEALFLTKFASKVYIVHRRDRLKASSIMAKRAFDSDKVDIIWNSELVKASGDDVLKSITIKNNKTGEEKEMAAAGIFFAIGREPSTAFLKDKLSLDQGGYIITKGKSSLTNVEGVFAAGDVQDPVYCQAVTAAGSGCIAALDVKNWLMENGY